MYIRNICLLTLLAVSLTSCYTIRNTYVDPQYHQANYGDIKPVVKKYTAVIDVEFQRNGERFSPADYALRHNVEKALRATGVVIPSAPPGDFYLKVTANNTGDLESAKAKGIATGLTLGAAGSTVTDFYEFTISLKNSNGDVVTKQYKHALISTIGIKSAPISNVESMKPDAAFGKVVEDVILNFVKEMQSQNILSFNYPMNYLVSDRDLTTVCQAPLAMLLIKRDMD